MPGPDKLKYALEWKVPIVSGEWLWDSIHEGALRPFDPYLIHHARHHLLKTQPKPSDAELDATKAHNHSSFSTRMIKDKGEHPLYSHTFDSVKNEEGAQPMDDSTLRVVEESPVKNRDPCRDSIGERGDETGTDPPHPDEGCHSLSQTLRPMTIPLKEISLNLSPKDPPSPPKVCSPSSKSVTSVKYDEETLGTAISSLLAHHQRLAATIPPAKPTEETKFGRRRRQLFGRAPSSMSARSNGSINISRASSVDTMNTDGLGTPLESSTANTRDEADGSFAVLHGIGEKERARDSFEAPLQMTQLGYEDPDVRAWRERVVKKLGGAEQIDPDAGRRVEGIGVVTDVRGRGSKGIGRRTRQALGR